MIYKVRDHFSNGKVLTHEFPTLEMALEMLSSVQAYARMVPQLFTRVSVLAPNGKEVAFWAPS